MQAAFAARTRWLCGRVARACIVHMRMWFWSKQFEGLSLQRMESWLEVTALYVLSLLAVYMYSGDGKYRLPGWVAVNGQAYYIHEGVAFTLGSCSQSCSHIIVGFQCWAVWCSRCGISFLRVVYLLQVRWT